MVERTGYTDGEPCWADVVAPDIEAGRRFYGAVLGWTFTEPVPEFGEYATCLKDGRPVAGISPPMPDAPPAPAAWSVYLWTGDADATTKLIEQGGGTVVVPPMEIPGQGRMAFASDPTGAAFGLWEPATHRGSELANEHGAMCWAEVNTRDGAAADAFYAGLFGYRQQQVGDGVTFDYTVWDVGGEPVVGRLAMTAEWGDLAPHWMIYFAVDDCDAAAALVTANGGEVRIAPFDSPHGRTTVVSDPNGAVLSLIDPSRTSAPDPTP